MRKLVKIYGWLNELLLVFLGPAIILFLRKLLIFRAKSAHTKNVIISLCSGVALDFYAMQLGFLGTPL